MSAPAPVIDINPMRKALGWLVEALMLWHAQPGAVTLPVASVPAAAPGRALSAPQARLVRQLLDRVLPGARVVIFGSRTSGRARPFSDLDLLLIEPPRRTWAQRADPRDAFEASTLPFSVDVVELAGLAEGMRQRVLAEALPLA